MTKSNQELEVKFYVADLETLRDRLARLGAITIQPRTYELNLRFDTPEAALAKKEHVLRLRRDTANRLTFKGQQRTSQGVSDRVEIEFSVGDFEKAQKLLEALGYQVHMIYEKYRTVYNLGGALVMLDEMPFGDFVEIEGNEVDQIREVSQQIGLMWELRTLQSYAMLFEIVKRNLGVELRDLSFENFAALSVGTAQLELLPADLNR